MCLAWGALATLMVIQHASAAHDVAATDETLSLDAQQIYQSLADADVTVSTAYLYGRTGPYADRVRYQHDIAVAAADLKVATAASGNSSVGGQPEHVVRRPAGLHRLRRGRPDLQFAGLPGGRLVHPGGLRGDARDHAARRPQRVRAGERRS